MTKEGEKGEKQTEKNEGWLIAFTESDQVKDDNNRRSCRGFFFAYFLFLFSPLKVHNDIY